MEEWIDQVKAVVWCGLPGQEAGSALANVLFGNRTPVLCSRQIHWKERQRLTALAFFDRQPFR